MCTFSPKEEELRYGVLFLFYENRKGAEGQRSLVQGYREYPPYIRTCGTYFPNMNVLVVIQETESALAKYRFNTAKENHVSPVED